MGNQKSQRVARPWRADITAGSGFMDTRSGDIWGGEKMTSKMEQGFWWCQRCECEVDSRAVTYEELHSLCGAPVDWFADDAERLGHHNDILKGALEEANEAVEFYCDLAQEAQKTAEELANALRQIRDEKRARCCNSKSSCHQCNDTKWCAGNYADMAYRKWKQWTKDLYAEFNYRCIS